MYKWRWQMAACGVLCFRHHRCVLCRIRCLKCRFQDLLSASMWNLKILADLAKCIWKKSRYFQWWQSTLRPACCSKWKSASFTEHAKNGFCSESSQNIKQDISSSSSVSLFDWQQHQHLRKSSLACDLEMRQSDVKDWRQTQAKSTQRKSLPSLQSLHLQPLFMFENCIRS